MQVIGSMYMTKRHGYWLLPVMENKITKQGMGQTLLQQAAHMESIGNAKEAAKLYRQSLKVQHRDEKAYNRLMVIFRKMKDYKNESFIIQRAIKAFENFHDERGKRISKQVAGASKAIMKALGLINKKGEPVYMPQPVERWSKRLDWVERKLGKAAFK